MIQSFLKRMKESAKGFTVIEIVVVIFIMTLLLSVVSIGTAKARALSRDVERVKIAKDIQGAITQYYIEHKQYPQLGQACANTDDDNNGTTPSSDDYPTNSDPSKWKHEMKDSDGNVIGSSGNGKNDSDEAGPKKVRGWGVGNGVDVFAYTTPVNGACPSMLEDAQYITDSGKAGNLTQTFTSSGCTIDKKFPSSVLPGQEFDKVSGVLAEDIGDSLMKKLYDGNYITKKTWDDYGELTSKGSTELQCRYVVPAAENIRDMDGNLNTGREGYVQHYLIHCNLEVKEDIEAGDGGFNDTVFEVVSPGSPWVCVAPTVDGLSSKGEEKVAKEKKKGGFFGKDGDKKWKEKQDEILKKWQEKQKEKGGGNGKGGGKND